ncbi:glycoside hydrolase family 2 TIM barrel-domain containing protein [Arthrobacter sp. NQ7]|uniref:glycoside hydrolase family 2 TIM barrel-domain containing protein n=1 Tax=Arthrobacter sp. NQ7 TaxID=3032303 RepID=UPI00240EA377|nr:glycoside hydrolase family 2 TIM barrel-domain containing protein [Arthrobacter sp. NQ7]MDJ0458649.1 glycoside hydrolase family 2 TIM barrel-domain containing protein [Arthrobacter sp. NQ7]
MSRTPFNEGWAYRVKATAFQELGGTTGADWREVALPHDALIATARSADAPRGETNGYFPGGAFEYRRTLHVPSDHSGKLVVLEFDGVYRDANVFVNGALAGQRAFGYSRFTVRIDQFLEFGTDNEIRVECRTHLDSRWYSGAGIYRNVHLHVKDPVHVAVDGIRVTTPDVEDDLAVVEVETITENFSATTTTARALTVLTRNGQEVARVDSPVTLLPRAQETVRQRLYVETPDLWDVETPNLYEATVTLRTEETADEVSTTFGIRTLQLDPRKGLRINGRGVKLRGACIHGDNGPLGTAAFADAEERKIRLLKDAGFNAIRSSHHPASSALLDACDRLGMLVMDEAFDVWTSAKSDYDYSYDFPQWWEKDVEAMVAKDFNHPSVIFYSIGNEIPETGNRFAAHWGRLLAEKVRSLDSTRFVTNGINGFVSVLDSVLEGMKQRRTEAAVSGGVNQMMGDFGPMMNQIQASSLVSTRTEESFSVLDVGGLNYGSARYELELEQFPARIVVGSETWVTEIDKNWPLVLEHPHVLGDFTWTGFDYLGEVGIGVTQYTRAENAGASSFATAYPGLTAWCGDLDITGVRRPQSYYREIVYGHRTEPYIAVQRPERFGQEIAMATPWSWSDTVSSWSWHGAEGRQVHVEVYANADEVELLLDGESLGRAMVGGTRKFRADFDVLFTPGELTAVSYVQGTEQARSSLRSATPQFTIQVRAEDDILDIGGLGFIRVTLSDESGVVHTGADRPIRLDVEGPAVLQAYGAGNPISAESFTGAEHCTFDGRALAIVRATGPGDIAVKATAEGIDPTVIILTCE